MAQSATTRLMTFTRIGKFGQIVGNEFPPVSACSKPARTHPPRKIRSRQPSARNFRRFLPVPELRGRIRRKKFIPANRRQGISAGFCVFPTRADASDARNSFPQTVGNEFPPVLACSRPARTHPPHKIRSRKPSATCRRSRTAFCRLRWACRRPPTVFRRSRWARRRPRKAFCRTWWARRRPRMAFCRSRWTCRRSRTAFCQVRRTRRRSRMAFCRSRWERTRDAGNPCVLFA